MNELALPVPGSKELAEVAEAALSLPQQDCPVIHRFGPGVYIREVSIPAGTFAVGRKHRHAHMNIMLEGEMLLRSDDGEEEHLIAPVSMTTEAGQKVAVVLKDTVWLNIYATEERDVEKLEEWIFDDDEYYIDHVNAVATQEYPKETLDIVHADYEEVVEALGFTVEEVRTLSEYKGDQIPFPDGGWPVTVKDSNIEGKGLFATANIVEGQVIAPSRIDCKRTPAGRYTNHSPFANAKMVMLPNGDVNLVALENISGMQGGLMGQELLVDYTYAFLDTRLENL